MATHRAHTRIDRPAAEVWEIVRDPVGLTKWFPGVESAELVDDGAARQVEIAGGISVVEAIVTNDDDLRRFQYAITGGPLPLEHHLATIDVIEDGDGTIVVYGLDVRPDDASQLLNPIAEAAVDALKAHAEQ